MFPRAVCGGTEPAGVLSLPATNFTILALMSETGVLPYLWNVVDRALLLCCCMCQGETEGVCVASRSTVDGKIVPSIFLQWGAACIYPRTRFMTDGGRASWIRR